MTRVEAAKKVAEIINADDCHAAKLWTKEAAVRLYLKFDTQAKKGWVDNGFIAFNMDGTITVSADRCASVAKNAVRQVEETISSVPAPAAAEPPNVDEDGNDWSVRDVAGDERGY